jgi:hypothetical protein
MDRAELMKMPPEDAIKVLSWDNIKWLFEPTTPFQLLLRLDYNGTIKVLRQKLDVINKLEEGKEMELWNEAKGYIAIEDYYRVLKEEKYKQEKRETMKFRITMKDPDGVYDSLKDSGYDLDDLPEDVQTLIDKYVEFGEYMNIEFDIMEQNARVVPRGE